MTISPSRLEDRRLVTGTGRYTADWNLPGQLHAAMIRSDHAHAEITRIDLTAVRKAPGVRAVIDAPTLSGAGFKPFPWGVVYNGRNNEPMRKAIHNALATSHVRYVGEPIAMVVADTEALARDAAELAVIEYRDLPVAVTMAAAAAPGAPQLHPNIPGNLGFDYEDGDKAATDAAFARAKFVTRVRMASQRVSSNPMEPRAVLARWNGEGRGYTIYTAHQGVLAMRGQLANVCDTPAEQFEVIADDVGGSYGTRICPYAEHLCALAAAKATGKPVKWVGSRSETFLSDHHGRGLELNGEIALDADGKILAFRYDDWGDMGGYQSAWSAFIASKGLTITMGGPYDVPALYGRVRCVYTNAVPVAAYRGAGRPDIATTIERLIDEAAAEHGFDRVELRRRNHIPRAKLPYKNPVGTVYDSGDFTGAMDRAMQLADWAGFPARRAEAKARGKLRGIGIATFLEAAAAGVAPKDQTEARFDAEGNLTIFSVGGASGQGHETTFAQIVAAELGVPIEKIRYRGSDPATRLVGNATGGSRTLAGAGSSFKVLGGRLVEIGREHAAHLLECAEADIEYTQGAYRVQGTDRAIGFFDLARRLAREVVAGGKHPLDSLAEVSSGATFPNGCHICEVEIDPATGVTAIIDYVACDDVGTRVSPQLVEGQVHGGVLQGIGQVLGEHAYYDPESGQFMSGSFLDYVMPRPDWAPRIDSADFPVPTPTNLLGAKGVGECGCAGGLASTLNAMHDALRPLGVGPLDMPLTPARVWAAIQTSKQRTN